jgi:hypothetical protein
MDAITLLLIIVLATIISDVIMIIIQSKFMKKPPAAPFHKDAMMGILGELNSLIDIEFMTVVEAPNAVRQVDIISDFEKVQTEVTRNVLNSLSTAFFVQANAAGLKQEYIMTYVARKTTLVVIDYMKTHNFNFKHE